MSKTFDPWAELLRIYYNTVSYSEIRYKALTDLYTVSYRIIP